MLVDDHPLMTLALGRYLEKVGFEVEQVNDSPRALRVAHTFQPHAMILDYQMPGLSGADVAWQFESDPVLQTVPIMICSGYAETISRADRAETVRRGRDRSVDTNTRCGGSMSNGSGAPLTAITLVP
jgi:CheY-like chemotaxis protein